MMEGGVACEVAAFLPFLLLDEPRKKNKKVQAIDKKSSYTVTSRGIYVSTYTNLYLSSSEVSESKRLDNLI